MGQWRTMQRRRDCVISRALSLELKDKGVTCPDATAAAKGIVTAATTGCAAMVVQWKVSLEKWHGSGALLEPS